MDSQKRLLIVLGSILKSLGSLGLMAAILTPIMEQIKPDAAMSATDTAITLTFGIFLRAIGDYCLNSK
ncbi:MAG: hypothetical protein FWC51_03960 [Proteobacteria bacterium]|nr:hypothetical protein [Pseudomonadota bacterium]